MRSPTQTLLTSLLACTLVACGGDGGGGGPVESGLPEDKTGDQLTAEEGETLCQAAADNFAGRLTAAQAKEARCVAAGIGFATFGDGTVESCEKLAQMCRDGAGEEGGEQGNGETCDLGFDLATCTATVADIEGCITEKNEAQAEALRSLSCDDLTKDPVDPVTGPACTAVKASCPGIA